MILHEQGLDEIVVKKLALNVKPADLVNGNVWLICKQFKP